MEKHSSHNLHDNQHGHPHAHLGQVTDDSANAITPQDLITKEKLSKYFQVTEKAYVMAKASKSRIGMVEQRADFLDMIERYISDAHHFKSKGSIVDAFAALNYAHGWLDAGARLGLFDVHDSTLFTVD